ncbi:pectin lyase-like protein [Penicillium odoratum]|uniref:pectin lyase-like protein n=1 Tax=Penicillium odoratum TaxID=1167516 RepID=UPI002546D434|nr:pectin lyase-like protein [Penicillium odoratum]KAJ5769030.1 pectin lyase-like protein [Penicillium odoratum]
MKIFDLFISVLYLGTTAFGTPAKGARANTVSRTTPPSGCLSVGSSGTYSTISAALTALGSGTYAEQIKIDYAGSLIIYGETTDSGLYKDNTVTITNTISSEEAGSLDLSATVNIVSDGVSLYNINVVNGYGKGAQAFSGYQDTLYAKSGTQYYSNCLIEGAVDYIFGDASAWFGECDIVSNGSGSITANSREESTDSSWYAIDHCNIKAASGVSLDGEVYLGRPWRVLARVIYQNSVLGDLINAAGWTTMATGATPLYYEYDNTGDGSSTSDRLYETSISAGVTKTTVLGSGYGDWIDEREKSEILDLSIRAQSIREKQEKNKKKRPREGSNFQPPD